MSLQPHILLHALLPRTTALPTHALFLRRQVQRYLATGSSGYLEGGGITWNVSHTLDLALPLVFLTAPCTCLFDSFYCCNIMRMYRGLSINYIRVVPMVSISFTVFDLMKNLLEPL
jgi:hypothetical protein